MFEKSLNKKDIHKIKIFKKSDLTNLAMILKKRYSHKKTGKILNIIPEQIIKICQIVWKSKGEVTQDKL